MKCLEFPYGRNGMSGIPIWDVWDVWNYLFEGEGVSLGPCSLQDPQQGNFGNHLENTAGIAWNSGNKSTKKNLPKTTRNLGFSLPTTPRNLEFTPPKITKKFGFHPKNTKELGFHPTKTPRNLGLTWLPCPRLILQEFPAPGCWLEFGKLILAVRSCSSTDLQMGLGSKPAPKIPIFILAWILGWNC